LEQPKLHILLVIEATYPWYRGGVSEWISQYLKAFPNYKFTVLQVVTDRFIHLKLSEALYQVPAHVENFLRVPAPVFSLNWDTDLKKWFSEYLDKLFIESKNFDFVHVTNTGFAGWAGTEFSKKLDIPLILTEHALYWKEIELGTTALECGYKLPKTKEGQFRFSEIFKSIAREVYTQSKYVISVSKTNLPDQKKLGVKNPLYIPNGVERSAFLKNEFQSSVLTVGWVGRCAKMKDPMKFLDLAELLYEYAQVDIRFKMILCNSNEKLLNERVNKRAKDLPFVEVIWNETAIKHMSKMHMLCLTSINESQPLILFEALAKKVLPVGWEVGDFTSEFGFVVSPDTTKQELVRKILSLWNDKETLKALTEKKYKEVKEKHNWTAIFDRYRTIIDSLQKAPHRHEEFV